MFRNIFEAKYFLEQFFFLWHIQNQSLFQAEHFRPKSCFAKLRPASLLSFLLLVNSELCKCETKITSTKVNKVKYFKESCVSKVVQVTYFEWNSLSKVV